MTIPDQGVVQPTPHTLAQKAALITGNSRVEENKKLLGILSLSLLQLGFEFLIMKMARYQFGTLAIGVIALGLLGVAAAGLSVRLFKTPERAIATACVALPVLGWLCMAVQTMQGFGPPSTSLSISNLLVLGVLAFVVLALCSVPIFAYIQENVSNVHRYYGASFVGGAVGIPVTLVLLEVAGDLLTASALLLLAIIPPLVLVTNARVRALAVSLGLIAGMTSVPIFEDLDQRAHPSSIYRKSDAMARIDVTKGRPANRFRFQDDPTFDDRMAIAFVQGGRGGLTSASPVAVEGSPKVLGGEIRWLPWALSPKKALVLGSGGGIELMGALRSGATEVHAVEIDGKVLDYLNRFAPATHNPYANPKVKTYIGEGRDISARIGRSEGATFDLVYIPTAVLRGQSGHVFAQNHLVTEEALHQYLGLLNKSGVLAVSFPLPKDLRARMTAAMSRALQHAGVRDPEEHIRVFQRAGRGLWVVLGRVGQPFTDSETEVLLTRSNRIELVDVRSELQIARGLQPFDDNHPFMFPEGVNESPNSADALDADEAGERRSAARPFAKSGVVDWNRQSVALILAGAVLLILCVFWSGVRAAGPGYRTPRSGYLACFTAIGGAYVIYQTLMVQRLSFLVGHPTLATAFILVTALFASGVGSLLSGKALAADRKVYRSVGTGLLVVWVISLSLIRPEWMILPSIPPVWKILAGIALCAPPFVMMGTYFAVALKRAEREASGSVTWGWALNGIAAIAGWAFMVSGSMAQGIRFAGLSPALVYGGVGIWEFLTADSVSERTRTLAHRGFAVLVIILLITSVWLSQKG